jgi:type IV pilus assembly protein PilM
MRRIGVEVAATEVRVVEISHIDDRGFAVVSRLARQPLPEGAIVAGRVRNAAQTAVTLRDAIRKAGVPTYGFILGFSCPEASIARVSLPAVVRPGEREGALRAMNADLNPAVPVDEAAIATRLLEVDDEESGSLQHLNACYVPEEQLDALLAVCDLARLEPRAVDLAPAGLMRAVLRVSAQDQEISTLVDVGATKTTIITREGQHLRSLRIIASGGADITRAIAAANGETFSSAERLKYDLTPRLSSASVMRAESFGSEVDEDEVAAVAADEAAAAAAARSVANLAEQVALAIESDASAFGSFTQGVTLCGLGSLQRGLREQIASRVGTPALIGRPWAVVERSRRNGAYFIDGQVDPKLMLACSTALGLALWEEVK